MKKNIIILFIVSVILLAAMGGCSGNNVPQTGTQPETTPVSTAQNTPPGNSPSSSATITPSVNPSASPASSPEAPISVNSEAPVAPEKNPPGDIPDDQVFIDYTSSQGGYSLKVPEGWSRTENGSSVQFADKFDGVSVSVSDVSYSLSVDEITKNYLPVLNSSERAVTVNSTKLEKYDNGQAIVISYSSNSEPDAVTNKQIRLENEAVVFISNGKMAVLKMWAPLGADNVDQWNLMKNSFKQG